MKVPHELVAVKQELFPFAIGVWPRRRKKVLIAESEDLPEMILQSHE